MNEQMMWNEFVQDFWSYDFEASIWEVSYQSKELLWSVHHIGVLPKCFTEFSDKNIFHYSKKDRTCHTTTSCVRDQHATTSPVRHM